MTTFLFNEDLRELGGTLRWVSGIFIISLCSNNSVLGLKKLLKCFYDLDF